MSARIFAASLWIATVLVLSFLLLPIVSVFLRVPLGELLDQLSSDVVRDAVRVTLKTNVVALVLILVLGTPTAYLIATRSFRGRAFVLTLVELPLVLPPAVAGIGLLCSSSVRLPGADPPVVSRSAAGRRRSGPASGRR